MTAQGKNTITITVTDTENGRADISIEVQSSSLKRILGANQGELTSAEALARIAIHTMVDASNGVERVEVAK